MIGLFLAFDIILFYVFFELTLVPLFFLIGIWGGPERRHAARKFFIYTLTGSLITLLGVLGAVLAVYYPRMEELTFSIPRLVQTLNARFALPGEHAFWQSVQFWVFLALIAGFSIKVPLVPLHTWLPLAHVDAPTAGSVLLAGVLLKIGMLYDRYHTRQLDDYGGMASRLKLLACFMVFMCLSSAGLPGLNGFIGEALVFLGMFSLRPSLAVIGTAGIVLGAWYLLRLLLRIFFGPVREPQYEGHEPVTDLNLREWAALVPIAVLCIWIGVYPRAILDTATRDLE